MKRAFPRPQAWAIIHLLITFSIPIALAYFSGCIKPPKVDPGQLGPEASDTDMEKAVSRAVYGLNPWNANLGQKIISDSNMRIESNDQVQLVARITQTLMKREEPSPTKLRLWVQDCVEKFDSSAPEKTDRSPMEFSRPASLNFNLNSPQFVQSDISASRTPVKTTYHNLEVQSGIMDPPAAVKAKPDCGGVPNCQMRFVKITYDEALWYSSEEYEIQRWSFTISRDAPFLGYMVEKCLASFVPYQGRRVYVRQCEFARDFEFSGGVPPSCS